MMEDEDYDSDSDFELDYQLPAHLKGLGVKLSPNMIYVGGNPDPTPLIASTISMSPTPPTFTHPNKFAPLDSEAADDDADTMADELNNRCNVVRRKSPKSSKPVIVPKKIDVLDSFTVRSENELDYLSQRHPYLAAIPTESLFEAGQSSSSVALTKPFV